MSAFAGTYSDIKLVRSRSVAQVVIEIPIEQFEPFVAAFGSPGFDTWIGFARMNKPGTVESQGHSDVEGRQAVQAAAMLCKDKVFQRWMLGPVYRDDNPSENERMTIQQVRVSLDIQSRAELNSNHEKLLEWRAMVRRYERETKATTALER